MAYNLACGFGIVFEPKGWPMNNWAVYRQDFTGNEFLVEKGLSEVRARELVEEYESHKHHQHYWADLQPADEIDFPALLAQMLADGSPMHLALSVLTTHGASRTDCVAALQQACGLSDEESEAEFEKNHSN